MDRARTICPVRKKIARRGARTGAACFDGSIFNRREKRRSVRHGRRRSARHALTPIAMPKAAPAAPKARLLPATAEEKAAHQAFDVAMRQLVIDLDQVDKNGDRKLDFNEFSALVREREIGIQNSATLRQRFDILDADGSGTIEMSEFFVYAMRDSLSRNKARLADLLAQWDADKNGTVERDEFRAVLRDQWGANLHTKDVDALFDDLDEDGSGTLDLVDLTRKLERPASYAKGREAGRVTIIRLAAGERRAQSARRQ